MDTSRRPDSESSERRSPRRSRSRRITDTEVIGLPTWAERRSTTRQPPRLDTVSLVIPTKNEALNLATVLEHVPDAVTEVILVDGLSWDVTETMAAACKPDVHILEEVSPGKGNALRAGFTAAKGDIIVAMDADGSMSPGEITNLLYFLEHGFDFVKGSRFMLGGGSLDITPIRRAGNRALVGLANHLYRTQLTDLCYGFFGFRRQFLDHLDLCSTGFEIERRSQSEPSSWACAWPKCPAWSSPEGAASRTCTPSGTESGSCGPCTVSGRVRSASRG